MSRTKAIGSAMSGRRNTVGQIPCPDPCAANAPTAVPDQDGYDAEQGHDDECRR